MDCESADGEFLPGVIGEDVMGATFTEETSWFWITDRFDNFLDVASMNWIREILFDFLGDIAVDWKFPTKDWLALCVLG